MRTGELGRLILSALLSLTLNFGTRFWDPGIKAGVVDFSRSDMRGLISTTATYVDCNFSHARLDKIDFQSSSFIRCRFAGEVREVLFYDNAFDPRKKEANPMEDVDFSQAQLRWVAFRRLNLDRVRLPESRDHLILKNYPCVLRKALAAVKDDESLHGRGLSRVLANYLKWAGPNQQVGVLNRLNFLEVWVRRVKYSQLSYSGERSKNA